MNAKKTLATLMVGVVAVSAMATVSVSAKAQKADEITWSTIGKEYISAETIVYINIPADSWNQYDILELRDTVNSGNIEVIELTKITARSSGNVYTIEEDLERFYLADGKDADGNVLSANEIQLITEAPDNSSDFEIAIKIRSNKAIAKNSITVDGFSASNVVKEASSREVGVLLNMDMPDEAGDERKNTIVIRDLDWEIDKHVNPANDPLKSFEPLEEIAERLKDVKGATITLGFSKENADDSVSDSKSGGWSSRYNWNETAMKSAISLRINSSNEFLVDMMEFDEVNFTAVYSWDEVVAKLQAGSTDTIGIKINNAKLPAKMNKANEVIELRLDSITIIIPEISETEDNTDFSAGESATVVEDTLSATTDAPVTTDAAVNPETGNSAAALLAIPAALVAAAVVAKKRG